MELSLTAQTNLLKNLQQSVSGDVVEPQRQTGAVRRRKFYRNLPSGYRAPRQICYRSVWLNGSPAHIAVECLAGHSESPDGSKLIAV